MVYIYTFFVLITLCVKVGILLIRGKVFHNRIISLIGEVWYH